jgi:hypothetical protein
VLSRQGMLAADFIAESRRGGEADVVERMAHAAVGDELAAEAHGASAETRTRQPSDA